MASSHTVCMEPRGRGVINTKSSIFVGTCKKGNKIRTSKTKQNKKTQPLNIFSKASCPLTEDSAYSSGPGPSSWTGGNQNVGLPFLHTCPRSLLCGTASEDSWDQRTDSPKIAAAECAHAHPVHMRMVTFPAGGAEVLAVSTTGLGLEGGFPPWCCFLQVLEEIKREMNVWLVCI